jgi:hypothetical protein
MALINGPITRGDYIKVTHQDAANNLDLLILGTALQDITAGSGVRFSVSLPGADRIGGANVELSLNDVDVTLLFAADVAREQVSA